MTAQQRLSSIRPTWKHSCGALKLTSISKNTTMLWKVSVLCYGQLACSLFYSFCYIPKYIHISYICSHTEGTVWQAVPRVWHPHGAWFGALTTLLNTPGQKSLLRHCVAAPVSTPNLSRNPHFNAGMFLFSRSLPYRSFRCKGIDGDWPESPRYKGEVDKIGDAANGEKRKNERRGNRWVFSSVAQNAHARTALVNMLPKYRYFL